MSDSEKTREFVKDCSNTELIETQAAIAQEMLSFSGIHEKAELLKAVTEELLSRCSNPNEWHTIGRVQIRIPEGTEIPEDPEERKTFLRQAVMDFLRP